MNSTENLWSILVAKVYANGKQFYNVNEITMAVLSGWADIELETLRSLLNLMPKRCVEDIKLSGNKTHY